MLPQEAVARWADDGSARVAPVGGVEDALLALPDLVRSTEVHVGGGVEGDPRVAVLVVVVAE